MKERFFGAAAPPRTPPLQGFLSEIFRGPAAPPRTPLLKGLLTRYNQIDNPPWHIDNSLDGRTVQIALYRINPLRGFHGLILGGTCWQLNGSAWATINLDGDGFRLAHQ